MTKTKRKILEKIIKDNVYWESEGLEALPTDDFAILVGVTDEGIDKIIKLFSDQFTPKELEIIKYDMNGLLNVSIFQRKVKGNPKDKKFVAFMMETERQDNLRKSILFKIDKKI